MGFRNTKSDSAARLWLKTNPLNMLNFYQKSRAKSPPGTVSVSLKQFLRFSALVYNDEGKQRNIYSFDSDELHYINFVRT